MIGAIKVRNLFHFGFLGLVVAACSTGNMGSTDKLPCRSAADYAAPTGAPYSAEEVRVQTDEGHVLVGTLTTPKRSEVPVPAVVLISGSSAQIRDMVGSTEYPFSLYQPFRQIADVLSRRGLAVLRLDDRGTGCSSGGPLSAATTAARADDTRAAVAFLRGRRKIDPQRLGLLGISEGANIAVMIAAKDMSLRGVVALAATASPGWQVWKYQTRYLISLGLEMDHAKKRRWLAGEDPEIILEERVAEARAHVRAGEANAWWTYFFPNDPSTVTPMITSPVLILHGDRDSNVPVAHAQKLAQAVKSGGNRDVTIKIFPDHNHLFLPDKDGGFRNYGKLLPHTNQVPDNVLNAIADWLVQRLMAEAKSSVKS